MSFLQSVACFLITMILLFPKTVPANNNNPPLGPAHENLIHPIDDVSLLVQDPMSASDVSSILKIMTPVKDQGKRGTCSIFSSVALLESLLIRDKGFSAIDLSEQWVEFLAITSKYEAVEGSWSFHNWAQIKKYGIVQEETLPYNPNKWEDNRFGLAKERCGHLLQGERLDRCLLTHLDPNLSLILQSKQRPELPYLNEFEQAKNEALDFKRVFLDSWLMPIRALYSGYHVYKISKIREKLNQVTPLVLSVNFFYGAWNHRKTELYGIGPINKGNWLKGIVGYPEPGSLDLKISPKHAAGHSVLIIGYDDQKIVKTRVKMVDGSFKEFTYRGVFYFKNSWGTDSFGADFTLGTKNLPGFGMITYEYAKKYGTFYHLPLKSL